MHGQKTWTENFGRNKYPEGESVVSSSKTHLTKAIQVKALCEQNTPHQRHQSMAICMSFKTSKPATPQTTHQAGAC
jgi:hypothetical protein